MATRKIDFHSLAASLLARGPDLVHAWLPGGKIIGKEYHCGSLQGGPGDSLGVNLQTGRWSDFATQDKGGDLVALYAAIKRISQIEAARELDSVSPSTSAPIAVPPSKALNLCPPPADAPPPDMQAHGWGNPTASWTYRGAGGEVLFHVARYDSGSRKHFLPWSWDSDSQSWVQKAWRVPRPLYGLDLLSKSPRSPVLLVEGEKSADAARSIVGERYVSVTWPNGAASTRSVDWTPLHGRKVLIWPDADAAGVAASEAMAASLMSVCQEVKVLDVGGQRNGWDVADAVADGWDWPRLVAWAKPRARLYQSAAAAVASAQVQIHLDGADHDPPASSSLLATWERIGVALSASQTPIPNIDNVVRILDGCPDLKELVWFDEFHQRLLTSWQSEKPREWTDVDNINLTLHLQRNLGVRRIGDETVSKAILAAAHKIKRNEPRDWMDSLKWDGHERCAHYFSGYMGADDNQYSYSVSRNFWIGMAARVYSPGCQLDNMVILEGPQGIFKSLSLRIIGGQWYAEAHASVTEKDFFLALQGRIIVEIAELDSFRRSETTRIKQVVTCTMDRYRPPYGRSAQDFPRRCVFVGTTNDECYLTDNTGGRRFWPIRCGRIDVASIAADREQLFAEAAWRFKVGETWHEVPSELAADEQESRRRTDEWESRVHEMLEERTQVTVSELAEGLKIPIANLDMMVQHRLGDIMRRSGWKRQLVKEGNVRRRIWVRPDMLTG